MSELNEPAARLQRIRLERRGEAALRAARRVEPGCEESNRLVRQASEHVRNDSCRRGVEPLHIVDRDQNRTRTRECPNRSERADRSFARLNAIVWARLAAQERNLERVALR